MRTFWRVTLLVVVVLAIALGYGAWSLRPEPVASTGWHAPALDLDAAAARLAEGIRIATISAKDESPEELARFGELRAIIERSFPRVHQAAQRELIGGGAMLYHWPGKDASCAPSLYAAHQDVVPVEAGTESAWKHPPFGGEIADGAIWGRGAEDDKGSLFAILEAAETLLASGFVPACDVYFGFGHDEEIGGRLGAARISKALQERGVKLAFGLDEGGAITTGAFPGLEAPLATIGVGEKGYVSLRLGVEAAGGHSSMPPRQTAIGILSSAIARLEADPFPVSIDAPTLDLLRAAGAELPFGQRLVFGNLWLTAPLVEHALGRDPATAAALRTTTAATMIDAGVKDNVLPSHAEAVVNFRIRTGDTVEGTRARVVGVIGDPRVKVSEYAPGFNPTPPAPVDDAAYRRVAAAVRLASAGEKIVVAPYVTQGATDLRHYAPLTTRLYRMAAEKTTVHDLERIHGTNERIDIAEYGRMIRFYLAMLSAPDAG